MNSDTVILKKETNNENTFTYQYRFMLIYTFTTTIQTFWVGEIYAHLCCIYLIKNTIKE